MDTPEYLAEQLEIAECWLQQLPEGAERDWWKSRLKELELRTSALQQREGRPAEHLPSQTDQPEPEPEPEP